MPKPEVNSGSAGAKAEPRPRHLMRWPGTSIARALRADRALAIAFGVLACGALAPLFVTPILPFPDLPSNVAGASMLVRTVLHQTAAVQFYRVEWLPFPYWTAYVVLGTASLLFGPFMAAKLLAAIVVLLLPLSLLRLALALGRDPRVCLFGFLLSWDHNLFVGWHSYGLGMAIGFVVLAKTVEAADDPRAAVRVIPWSLLLALTHPLAVLFVGVAAVLLLARERPTMLRLKTLAIALSGAAVAIIAWLLGRALSPRPPGGTVPWHVDYPTAAQKVIGLFTFSLDDLTGPFGEMTAALAFTLLLLGPAAFVCAPKTELTAEDDGRRWAGALVALAALALYAGLPWQIYGPIQHWYTYPRFASYLLATLPFVPPIRRIATGWLAAAVAIALAFNVATVSALAGFGKRVRPFLQLVDQVPAGARLLPLEFVDQDEGFKGAPLAHLHSYITAKGLYDPHMFDNADTPIRYREGLSIPRISWLGPRGFTLEAYAPHYDYMLVQGLASDPFPAAPAAGGYHVSLMREAGIWRLYQVVKD
jgi:hypothetical protein